MKSLYPPIKPYKTEMLKVSDLHTLYVEESGNKEGTPVIFLHGGPGSKSQGKYRQFFNPVKYRIIMFDQRGCGQSTPQGELEENTTQELVEDIEKIRKHLNIESWIVFGGSWGSTLALAYAQRHPEQVSHLILRGIFMFRRSEIDWLYGGGPKDLFPDLWEQYISPLSEEERTDIVSVYTKRVLEGDRLAIQAVRTWEEQLSVLVAEEKEENEVLDDGGMSSYQILFHYIQNKGFLEDGELLKHTDKIKHIPTTIVQGRYDMICPMVTAWDLHNSLPDADFYVVSDAGHNAKEPGITATLVEVMDTIAGVGL